MAFDTVIKRARYTVIGIPAATMRDVATGVQFSIMRRILNGVNVSDQPAKPLSMISKKKGGSYMNQKGRRHPPAIRNWRYTGFLLSQLHVLEASNNQAKIGFAEALHPGPYGPNLPRAVKKQMLVSQIVAINQSREKQFGLSPTDAKAYSDGLGASGVLNHIVVAKQV